MDFIVEVDKLRGIYRASRIMHEPERRENDAEHSWHIALMAMILSEYANEPDIDLLTVIKMLLIHDIVEIDAGDTFVYDEQAKLTQAEREERAAARLFGLLPEDQRTELYRLWKEFEEKQTPEARFAAAIDRLQPLLANVNTEGASWKEHGVTNDRVLAVNGRIEQGSEALWQYARRLIDHAVEHGYLAEPDR
jgi:putative hydrolase of HD superfamily